MTRPTTRNVAAAKSAVPRSEEHTSELQSRLHLVCRLLLEKKKTPRFYPKQEERKPRSIGQYPTRLWALGLSTGKMPALARFSVQEKSVGLVFFFKLQGAPRNLPPFPPRRSSN